MRVKTSRTASTKGVIRHGSDPYRVHELATRFRVVDGGPSSATTWYSRLRSITVYRPRSAIPNRTTSPCVCPTIVAGGHRPYIRDLLSERLGAQALRAVCAALYPARSIGEHCPASAGPGSNSARCWLPKQGRKSYHRIRTRRYRSPGALLRLDLEPQSATRCSPHGGPGIFHRAGPPAYLFMSSLHFGARILAHLASCLYGFRPSPTPIEIDLALAGMAVPVPAPRSGQLGCRIC